MPLPQGQYNKSLGEVVVAPGMPVYLTAGTVQELGLRQRKAMNMCLQLRPPPQFSGVLAWVLAR